MVGAPYDSYEKVALLEVPPNGKENWKYTSTQAKHVVFRYRVYQTVDIVVTIEKLDLLPPKI